MESKLWEEKLNLLHESDIQTERYISFYHVKNLCFERNLLMNEKEGNHVYVIIVYFKWEVII